MKHPSYKKVSSEENQIIEIMEVKEPHFYPFWHFHPENEIAAEASLSPTAFCRYFKSRTNKTFVGFLNEIGFGHACKLLMERKKNASEICYESELITLQILIFSSGK